MDIKFVFGIMSAIVALVCFIPYIKDILKKQTKPHIYTWLIWLILQTVAVISQFKDGAGYGAWGLTVGLTFCFCIFLLSFKYGTKDIKKFDIFCLVSSFIIIGFYLISKNPLVTMILITIIDFIGFLPTFRKGFNDPNTETTSTFALSALSNIFSLVALQNYTIVTTLYLASLAISNSSFVIMIELRKRALLRNK